MRAFVLSTVAGVTLAFGATGIAHAAVMTVGGPLSAICYESARSGDGRSAAVEGCNRALTEESLNRTDRAATHVNRGIVLMAAGRLDAADSDFDSALQLNGGLADGWLNKGFLRLRLGQGRAALPLIQKGIDAGAERQALAIFARGVAREQMGEFGAAYADLRRAQQLEPEWSLPRQYLASYQVRR
jgi:tetratricopeptide (TPR) repeat protein